MKTRSARTVPFTVTLLLAVALTAQIVAAKYRPAPQASAEALPPVPSNTGLRLASLSEPVAAAQLTALYLQAFDNQPGISIPFRKLDYAQVERWLARILELDPQGQYPLLMASHLYAQVPDPAKQRQMLRFVRQNFSDDPARRWPWLAHAALIAKHRLHDLPLALSYADAIANHANAPDIPHWATQMRIFLLEDMGEAESAKILLGGLLASGTITDAHELHFLTERLHALETQPKAK